MEKQAPIRKYKLSKRPFVSICTPTFNRRPFIPYIIKCFEHQTYPKDLMEWIIIDDGTDPIEDLVKHIPQVKYFRYNEKLTLGKKRNLSHEKSCGEVIVYMDDDDYYPPERVSHAVDILKKTPSALCAGSSEMHIYFKHINQMYRFGPYHMTHATAATFAFKRDLLKQTRYTETACLAEERDFLKAYTIPFVQLDTTKTILVFSHIHNSFDKKIALKDAPNQFVMPSEKTVDDFIKQPVLKAFYMDQVDDVLKTYEPGKLDYKPDVIKQINEIQTKRAKEMEEKQMNFNNLNNDQKVNELTGIINNLAAENHALKEKVTYLDNKIRQIIQDQIVARKMATTL
jgi:glycosyltransferase involved in cell wall biosynthesis